MSEKWTPEQFWEFMKGYTGEFETGHIRDMLDDSGLILAVSPQWRCLMSEHAELLKSIDQLCHPQADECLPESYRVQRLVEVAGKAADILRRAPSAGSPAPAVTERRDIGDIWQELLDKDDRTSPEEYPEMVLIGFDELADIIEGQRAADTQRTAMTASAEPVAWRFRDTSGNWLYLEAEPTLLTAGRLNEVQPLYATPPSDAAREALLRMALDELRGLAIKQHVRPAYEGRFVNNGQSCAVCKGEWADDAPEFHAETCPLSAAPVSAPKQWHHKKSGHIVAEIGRGRAQAATPIDEMADVVVYEHDGNIWVRAVSEFEDGRFEALPPPRKERGVEAS